MQRYEKFLRWRGISSRRFSSREDLQEVREVGGVGGVREVKGVREFKEVKGQQPCSLLGGIALGRAWHLARPLLYYILIIFN